MWKMLRKMQLKATIQHLDIRFGIIQILHRFNEWGEILIRSYINKAQNRFTNGRTRNYDKMIFVKLWGLFQKTNASNSVRIFEFFGNIFQMHQKKSHYAIIFYGKYLTVAQIYISNIFCEFSNLQKEKSTEVKIKQS